MNKGFTLIELLAVIIILTIIVVIVTPIITEVMNNAERKSILASVDKYVDSVRVALANRLLDDKNIEDGTYNIINDDNICLGTYENNSCTGEILTVKKEGNLPNLGTITIKDSEISNIDLIYDDGVISLNKNGKAIYKD